MTGGGMTEMAEKPTMADAACQTEDIEYVGLSRADDERSTTVSESKADASLLERFCSLFRKKQNGNRELDEANSGNTLWPVVRRIRATSVLSVERVSRRKVKTLMVQWKSPEDVQAVIVKNCPALGDVPVEIGQFVNVRSVCLTNLGLTEFPWPVLLLRQLLELDLSGNELLTGLPRTIGHMKRLKVLDISYCSISHLPTELLHLKHLQTLDADGNRLISPTEDVVKEGMSAVRAFLEKRALEVAKRHDLWARSTAFGGDGLVDAEKEVESLKDLTLRYILDLHPELLMRTVLPPQTKRFLLEQQRAQKEDLRVLKCSKCGAYFTTHFIFEMHTCQGAPRQ